MRTFPDHIPQLPPPHGPLFEVALLSPYSSALSGHPDGPHWRTLCWAPTRMWADDIAEAWLARPDTYHVAAGVWFEGERVALHERPTR